MCPVEGDYIQDPAYVHVDNSERSIAHPVSQPGLVVLHVCVRLERLYTLKRWVSDAHYQGDLSRQSTCNSLVKQVVKHD